MVARCALSGLSTLLQSHNPSLNKSATFNHFRYDCFLQSIIQLKTMTKTTQGLSPSLILLMSIATGLAVASNYYAQPLLDTIARNFSLSASTAGFIVTAAQLGYAAGLLFLVPLGDMFERRMLIVSMTLLAAGGMLITASSQSLGMLILGTALTGLFSVVAQILVPLAATLATPDKRGKVVGTIMSGLLLGILLARTVAGLLANLGGWRTVFWVASVLMALMAVALWRGLPKMKSDTHLNYPQLLGSVFSLFINDKLLRTRAMLGCLTFANFSILWTSMAFLLAAPPFNYSEGMIGLFGLAGAAGALGARPAGGFADKGKSHLTTTMGLLLLLLSWLAIWFGHASVPMLIIGILVLDLTVQGVHITNQTVIYRIHPDARNRLTAGYMTSYFIGGAAGSLISASAWQHAGWAGVCLAGTTVAILNLLVWWRGFHRQEAVN
ncbi:transmembrane transporter [Citrobacter freundii]|jgi:predicted MFS family arabinose efflux permease|nr:transmembrane transporter [Citrobacter freundii]SQA82132.1 major facilitator superfamily protein [Citrobacter freundii]